MLNNVLVDFFFTKSSFTQAVSRVMQLLLIQPYFATGKSVQVKRK